MLQHPLGRTNLNVSMMSLGGASFGQQYGPISLAETDETIRSAIDAGVNLIDTSAFYGLGQSEELIGEVLSKGLRDRVSICTKAGRLDRDRFDFSARGMRNCFEASLKRLKTDHVEILLAHDIEFADNFEQIFTETYGVLQDLKSEGKCRYIGMSCLPLGLLEQAITRCSLDVVISYCHYNLQNTLLLTKLLSVAEARGVGVLNASPLSMGLLTNQGPPPWHPALEPIKVVCRRAAKYCADNGGDIAELGMQFCFAEPRISSTITGTAKKGELEVNLKALQKPLNRELLAGVEAILKSVKDDIWPSGNWRPA